MKKTLSKIAAVITVIALLPFVAFTAYANTEAWDGTSVDTDWYTNAPAGTIIYTIDTPAELAGLAQLVNTSNTSFFNKTIMLDADIDLNDQYWTPIGGTTSSKYYFTGEFNGNGHTISNLKIDGTKFSYNKVQMGLFGRVGNGSSGYGAYLHDFTIKEAEIVNIKDATGVVAGYLGHDVVMENIVVENATVTGIGSAIAGVVWSSQLKNIVARNVTINAPSGGEVGGLFTFVQSYTYPYDNDYTTVKSFTAKNDIDPANTIPNYCLPGTIMTDDSPENLLNNHVFVCYFEDIHGENITINVTKANSYVGGFVSYNLDYPGDTMFCKDCSLTDLEINIVTTNGSPIVGGFIGLCATIMNYEYTDLDGNNVVVGGFENCSVDGEINGLGGLYGGFVGQSRLYRVSASGRPGFNPVTDRSYDKAVANVDIVASASATVGGFAGEVNTAKALGGGNVATEQAFVECKALGTTKLGDADALGSGFIGKSITNSSKGIVLEYCTVSGMDHIDEYLTQAQLTDSTVTKEDIIKKLLLGNGFDSANFKATGAIIFDTDGGSDIPSVKGPLGTPVTVPSDPTKDGYTFTGWNKEILSIVPGSVVTVTAVWQANSYTITFDTNGGSDIVPITQDFGTAVTAPEAPTLEEYTFDGWYIDAELTKAYEFTTMPAENITVYAKWTPITVDVPVTGDSVSIILGFACATLSIISVAVIAIIGKRKCFR